MIYYLSGTYSAWNTVTPAERADNIVGDCSRVLGPAGETGIQDTVLKETQDSMKKGIFSEELNRP